MLYLHVSSPPLCSTFYFLPGPLLQPLWPTSHSENLACMWLSQGLCIRLFPSSAMLLLLKSSWLSPLSPSTVCKYHLCCEIPNCLPTLKMPPRFQHLLCPFCFFFIEFITFWCCTCYLCNYICFSWSPQNVLIKAGSFVLVHSTLEEGQH